MSNLLLIKNGRVIVGEDASVERVDILVRDGEIIQIGDSISFPTARAVENLKLIDATDKLISPGFIQTHIHLCQTLFRGSADDLELLDWLKGHIWPMEAAHTPESLVASAQLGVAEMIKGGTTAALTMETVNYTEAVLETVEKIGFRAIIGKCMMDKGDSIPSGLREKTKKSVDESVRLMKRWKDRSRLVRYCFAPRFAVSCTKELLEEVARIAKETGTIIHTHASENRREIEIVENETGYRNIQYLNHLGITGKNVALAHCIHVNRAEQKILLETETNVLHCPSSNLKLSSGIAPVWEMVEQGVPVSLGADGAACNNNLDIFTEMRLAALLQKMRRGPRSLPAKTVFKMATINGAKTLGLEKEIGSIEVGKRADFVIFNLQQLHTTPAPDPISTIVYAAKSSDVETVIIDGHVAMKNRLLQTIDENEVMEKAKIEFKSLLKRAKL